MVDDGLHPEEVRPNPIARRRAKRFFPAGRLHLSSGLAINAFFGRR
jgi:hypothetical protein